MSDLFIELWGTGTRVVLIHGSLATGAEEWQAQRPLADEGFQLLVWVVRFLEAVGSNPAAMPSELIAAAEPLVPVLRRGRPIWERDLPLTVLAAGPYPKLVVS